MDSYSALLKKQVVGNIVLNYFIAYYLSAHTLAVIKTIPLQAPQENVMAPNMAGDLMVGSFIMGVILTSILTLIVRKQLNAFEAPDSVLPSAIVKLPQNLFARAIVMGLFGMFLVGMPVAIALGLLGVQQVSTQDYIFYHAIYCALLAGLMSYMVVKRVMFERAYATMPLTE